MIALGWPKSLPALSLWTRLSLCTGGEGSDCLDLQYFILPLHPFHLHVHACKKHAKEHASSPRSIDLLRRLDILFSVSLPSQFYNGYKTFRVKKKPKNQLFFFSFHSNPIFSGMAIIIYFMLENPCSLQALRVSFRELFHSTWFLSHIYLWEAYHIYNSLAEEMLCVFSITQTQQSGFKTLNIRAIKMKYSFSI